MVGLQVPRSEAALVKNRVGVDSRSTALMALGKLHQQWIRSAGGSFCENKVASENDDSKCEISPLVSYDGEDLSGQFMHPIQLPFYLPSQQEVAESSSVAPAFSKRASIHYLNMDNDLAQREMEMELQGRLGKTMDKVQTGNQEEYQGERAGEDELLPPTPRAADLGTYVDDLRTSPRAASARLSGRVGNTNANTSGRKASEQAIKEAQG